MPEPPEMTARQKALILITEIDRALARGTKHFNKAGELLETRLEVLTCMIDEGGVTFEPPEFKHLRN